MIGTQALETAVICTASIVVVGLLIYYVVAYLAKREYQRFRSDRAPRCLFQMLPDPTNPAPPMPGVASPRCQKGFLSTPAVKFNYDDPAPHSTKLNILTVGGICITSIWQDGCGFIAWAPLPDRDKEREREKGLL